MGAAAAGANFNFRTSLCTALPLEGGLDKCSDTKRTKYSFMWGTRKFGPRS
jgi:hypothetical protein